MFSNGLAHLSWTLLGQQDGGASLHKAHPSRRAQACSHSGGQVPSHRTGQTQMPKLLLASHLLKPIGHSKSYWAKPQFKGKKK